MRWWRLRDHAFNFDVTAFAYAHRGLWNADRPENSIAAFRAAAAAGVGVELDVRVTADGSLVVFHDATFERMCGHAARVDEMTIPAIKRLRLPDQSAVPSLEDVLEIMGELPTLVEVKVDPLPFAQTPTRSPVEPTLDGLRFSNALAGVMSFDGPATRRLAADIAFNGSGRPAGQLIEPPPAGGEDPLAPGDLEAILAKADQALANEAGYLAPHISCLEIVARAYPGVPLVTWTVRTPAELEAARRFGAAPIFEGFSPALAKPA